MATRVWVLALLAGCGGGGDGKKGEDGPAQKLPSPYVADESTPPEPSAGLAEVEQALQAGVDAAPEVTPAPVRAAYDAAMSTSDPYCPYFFTGPDGDYWFDECTSELGAEFAGYVFGLDGESLYDPESGLLYDAWYVAGAATVTTAAEELLVVGGTAYQVEYEDEVSQTWQSIVQGTFSWDGPEADGSWMAAGWDPDLVSVWIRYPTYEGHAAIFDGGIGRLGPEGQWAIAFDEALLIDAFLGSPCPTEPDGTISVRAADGSWYDIRFHGPDGETFETSGPCDGCGEVFYQGESIGEVCADFSGWNAWGVAPW